MQESEFTGWESNPVHTEAKERADAIRAEMTPERAKTRDLGKEEYDPKAQEWYKRWSAWNRLVSLGKKHSYGGTVAPTEVARRRKANKVATQSRRKNR